MNSGRVNNEITISIDEIWDIRRRIKYDYEDETCSYSVAGKRFGPLPLVEGENMKDLLNYICQTIIAEGRKCD